MARVPGLVMVVALAAGWPTAASSQGTAKVVSQAGTVVATVGGTEIQRASAGPWQLAMVGSSLFSGDRVRTRATSRLKLVFQDDSVVDVGRATELVIGQQLFDPAAGSYRSTLSLVAGKVRALVGEHYRNKGALYEIETPTAIAGASGTEFLIEHDDKGGYSDVVGIEGQVLVEGRLGVVGGGVQIGPQEATRVQKGRFPSAPRRIDDALLGQYLQGLDIMGTGGRDSLMNGHTAVEGKLLAPGDGVLAATGRRGRTVGTSGLIVGAPDEPAASRLSRDVGANTQPLLEYRIRPPR